VKVTARQDREPIVDGILSGWKEVNLHYISLRAMRLTSREIFYRCHRTYLSFKLLLAADGRL
jgi:hypothetical protein